MNVAVVVVAHGSRSRDAYQDIQEVAAFLEEVLSRYRLKVYLAFIEKKEGVPVPDWRELLERLLRDGVSYITIVPLFIAKGMHVEHDVVGELLREPVFGRWTETRWRGYTFSVYVAPPISRSILFRLAVASSIMRSVEVFRHDRVRDVEEIDGIEIESLKRIDSILSSIGLSATDFERIVISRAVFASGNIDIAYHVYVHPMFLDVARESLATKALPIVADVKMVYSGIRWREKYTFIDHEDAARLARENKLTRAAASMIVAASKFKTFVPVIGNSPSALLQVLKMVRDGDLEVPFIIATPPGFVNATVAKEKLVEIELPCITVRGSYGGSSLAVAIFNGVVDYVVQR